VNSSVTGIPKRVESTGPRCDLATLRHEPKCSNSKGNSESEGRSEENGELSRRNKGFDEGDEGDDLKETEHSEGRHVFRGEEGKEADEGNLHRGESTDGVERRVGGVKASVVSTHEEEDEDVEREHVGDESVST